jgi:hypothetical protein
VNLSIELDREDDGRWIAEALALPGVMTCGATREEAISKPSVWRSKSSPTASGTEKCRLPRQRTFQGNRPIRVKSLDEIFHQNGVATAEPTGSSWRGENEHEAENEAQAFQASAFVKEGIATASTRCDHSSPPITISDG